jgi:UDP-3-O-[3-hydroxymyristoyl] glucosamine N-acyltransferase
MTMEAPKQPLPEIHILRCGGRHASVVYDAITTATSLNDNPSQHLDTAAGVVAASQSHFVVWDDSKSVHPSLEKFERISCLKRFVDNIGVIYASHNVEEAADDVIDGNVLSLCVYICHGNPAVRRKLVAEMEEEINQYHSNNGNSTKNLKVSFPTVIHPTSFISTSSKLGRGSFVGPQALVHTHATVGEFSIINSLSTVEHDCSVGDYCNVNSGGTLCGTVTLGDGSTIGAGATVRDDVSIAALTVVGMQAGVVGNVVEKNTVMLGVPSKKREARNAVVVDVPSATKEEDDVVEKGTLDEKDSLRWCYKKKFSIDRFHQYLHPSLVKGHLTNDGPLQKVASAKVQHLCGSNTTTRKVLLTASGTAALHTLASAWEMRRGRCLRWVTQSFTFPSAIQGPMSNSIVVDVDGEHGGPSLKELEGLEEEFDGLVVTNCFGQPNDVLTYERWCKEHG